MGMRILARLKSGIPLAASGLLVLLAVAGSTQPQASLPENPSILPGGGLPAHKVSNPAAVYCTDLGYEYITITDGSGGQVGTCRLPDGNVCTAWDFLEGKCGQSYSYCARQGMGMRTVDDGKDPFSFEYAVCVDLQGRDIGNVTTIDNLAAKLNRCGTGDASTGATTNPPIASLQSQAASGQPQLAITGNLPSSWDWRKATFNGVSGDWTTPVKDQGGCGSCWAFAAVAQAEAVLNLAANDPDLDKNLSEEYLVSDCSDAGSCCGGWHNAALDFIYNQGIPDEACLPYLSGACRCLGSGVCSGECTLNRTAHCANATCTQRCSDFASRLSYIDSYGQVGSKQNAPNIQQTLIKQALVTYGPLSVAMDAARGDNYWKGDVFMCSNPPEEDHAVLLVGYNDTGRYWIVKNSWGSGWNGDGYFKVGYGQCLIENYVYYAQVTVRWIISGHVLDSVGTAMSGVVMNGLPGSPVTNIKGFYSDQLSNAWSGVVVPDKKGYVFNPSSVNYSHVNNNQVNQDYIGTHKSDSFQRQIYLPLIVQP